MALKDFVHFSLTVHNLERSLPFYRDILGFEVLAVKKNSFPGLGTSLGAGQAEAQLKIAFLKLPDEHIQIELIEYVNPRGELNYHPANAGTCHIAFRVDDIIAETKRLKELGVKFNSEVNIQTEGDFKGWKWVYFKDPDGINLELVEAKKDGAP